jgi:hypothetical protein
MVVSIIPNQLFVRSLENARKREKTQGKGKSKETIIVGIIAATPTSSPSDE